VEALHVRTVPGAEIKNMSGVLRSTNGTAHSTFQCAASTESVWNCTVTVGSCAACGRWSIERLDVTTADGHVIEVPASQPPMSRAAVFLSGDRCDTLPPVLNAVSIDAGDAENGGDIIVMLTVADEYCGIASIMGTVTSTAGETVRLTANLAGEENTWAARFHISRSTARGKWHISALELWDQAGNSRSYAEGDPLLRDAEFEVR
jgi:hypothetical protein